MKKTKEIYKFLLILILIFFSNPILSQTRIEGEIILGALGTGSNGWYYEWRAYSELRWWSDHCLTNNYYSGQTNIIYRPDDEGFGISSPTSPGEHNIAYGIYKFTFICDNLGIRKSFYIDLRDANWSMEQPPYPFPVDLYICYNNNVGYKKFQHRLASTGNWKDLGSSETIWELWHNDPPNQAVFQPTPPLIFICTNPNTNGEHPHFTWYPPQGPDFDENFPWNFNYNIYRKSDGQSYRKVAENLTGDEISDLAWTDEEITIGRPGGFYDYYAVAHTGYSPESDHSEHEIIRGNPSKPVVENDDLYFPDNDKINDIKNVKLTIFPNPFNPSTNISYYLAKDGYVKLSIYNITGQEIAELINEFKYKGEYSVSFNGQSLAGGIYFILLRVNGWQMTRKFLLLQ